MSGRIDLTTIAPARVILKDTYVKGLTLTQSYGSMCAPVDSMILPAGTILSVASGTSRAQPYWGTNCTTNEPTNLTVYVASPGVFRTLPNVFIQNADGTSNSDLGAVTSILSNGVLVTTSPVSGYVSGAVLYQRPATDNGTGDPAYVLLERAELRVPGTTTRTDQQVPVLMDGVVALPNLNGADNRTIRLLPQWLSYSPSLIIFEQSYS